jgi:hypothetical protein
MNKQEEYLAHEYLDSKKHTITYSNIVSSREAFQMPRKYDSFNFYIW